MPGPLRSDDFLTPASLAMPRQGIVLADTSLRVTSRRGAASPRDWTVCGVKRLLFPPAVLRDYRFGLAFREHASDTLILDNQDEYEDPLFLNQRIEDPNILLSQAADWQPNLYTRTGTFHRYLAGRLVSFGVTSRLSVSAEADEVFLELDVLNRCEEMLALTVIPGQRLARVYRPDTVSRPLGSTLQPEPDAERTPRFVYRMNGWQVAVASDLALDRDAGWRFDVPAGGSATARFVLSILPLARADPPRRLADLDARIGRAQKATEELLAWAAGQLPRVQTASAAFDEFYARSALTMLMCRLDRPGYVTQPFYDLGSLWGKSVLWDLSFASAAIAMLEPEALKGMIAAHIRAGIFNATYMSWDGTGGHWYAQSPFALLRIVRDCIAQAGNPAYLDERIGEATVYEHLCDIGRELHRRYARGDGLLDFGGGLAVMLEIRTSGYEHVVAAGNGMAAAYFAQLAAWGRARNDPCAGEFEEWERRIHEAMQQTLWDEDAGWFVNLYPDGSPHRVMSYHLFELLDTSALLPEQRRRLVAHLEGGDFTGPFGLHSIARCDLTHYDREDCDWGGGGQFVGMPLRIAESLFRMGERRAAWNLIKRCTRWTERLPYWPQTIYADELALQPHQADWPLQLAGGGGVQAVVRGVFGLRPRCDGTLEVQPACEADLGDAQLSGYRFGGHVYDVAMSARGFVVMEDGREVARGRPGDRRETPRGTPNRT